MLQLKPGPRHIAVVVSPLNALMQNQVQMGRKHNIECTAIHSESGVDLKTVNIDNYSVIFISPEQALSRKFRSLLDANFKNRLCVMAFDEAHCITQWGQTKFRPEYGRMADLLAVLPKTPVLVLTATMSSVMEANTMTAINICDYVTVAASPDRPEIFLDVKAHSDDCLKWLTHELIDKQDKCEKSLIYCRTILQVMEVFGLFLKELKDRVHIPPHIKKGENRLVEQFSSSVDETSKKRILRLFSTDSKLRVVITTVAFGMGIDIPNIRNVIFWGIPESCCHFWQQVGRACRDGQNGNAIVYTRRLPPNLTTSVELKEALHPSLGQCVRLEILKLMWMPAMGRLPVKEQVCKLSCTTCNCEYCICCWFCRSLCPCRKAV